MDAEFEALLDRLVPHRHTLALEPEVPRPVPEDIADWRLCSGDGCDYPHWLPPGRRSCPEHPEATFTRYGAWECGNCSHTTGRARKAAPPEPCPACGWADWGRVDEAMFALPPLSAAEVREHEAARWMAERQQALPL